MARAEALYNFGVFLTAFDYKEVLTKACRDPTFYLQAFQILVHQGEETGLLKIWDLKNEAELSLLCDLSLVQDSFRMRCLRRARLTALYLIDENGEIDKRKLEQMIGFLGKAGFVPYPEASSDAMITLHMLRVLKTVQEELPRFQKFFKRFQKPLCHKWAERLVRDSLGLYSGSGITDWQIRTAVLSSCLTFLRQNVGSCFATAPAILIHSDQVERFLEDLLELLSTGKLKRTFGGVEFSVPLSPSSGVGDLRKGIVLKDQRGKIWCSSGLMAAFVAAGILDPADSLPRKIAIQEELLRPFLNQDIEISIEQMLHQILLVVNEVSEEDLEYSRRTELALARQSKFTAGVSEEASSQRLGNAQKMLLKEKEAKAAFKGMCDHPLLKAWEFTLASFSEVKMEFSRWNLYSSLGLNPEESGGIGEIIYQHLQGKLDESNAKLQESQIAYELAYDQLRATEHLLKQAATEREIRRLQAEFQSRLYHMQSCQDMRDKFYEAASHYSSLFSFVIQQYDAKFPEYFQEIYDAEMQDIGQGIYDDSPAGFRLVYKHGRSDASQWTMIYTSDEYVEALVDFFAATEALVSGASDWEEGQKEILNITTAIISHVRTKKFLDSALQRMATAHYALAKKGSIDSISVAEKKPWAYTSGGTMTTILKTYFRREAEITEEARWVENEAELLIFFLDVLKNLPPKTMEPYLKDPGKGMLISSPSHAFVLHPGWEPFCEGWKDEGFTYTWTRDQIFLPMQKFFAALAFSSTEQNFLVEQFSAQLPLQIAHQLQSGFSYSEKSISLESFREKVLEVIFSDMPAANNAQKALFCEGLDAFLYQALPLIPGRSWKIVLRRILSDVMDEKVEEILHKLPDKPCEMMSAKDLREAAKGCYLLAHNSPVLPFDLHEYVCRHAQILGVSPPKPCLFADTNWSNYQFGFLVNPGTGRLEMWRLDRTGTEGMPMSNWKHWVNGTDRKPWSLCVRPHEYGE